MTPCHAYVCLHLCFGLCDRTERKLRSTQMLTRVRRAARRSRHQARRLRVCARLLGTSMRCVCVYIARMVCHGASQKSGLSQPRARANIACDIRNEHAARTPNPRLGGQHAFSACRRASSPIVQSDHDHQWRFSPLPSLVLLALFFSPLLLSPPIALTVFRLVPTSLAALPQGL